MIRLYGYTLLIDFMGFSDGAFYLKSSMVKMGAVYQLLFTLSVPKLFRKALTFFKANSFSNTLFQYCFFFSVTIPITYLSVISIMSGLCQRAIALINSLMMNSQISLRAFELPMYYRMCNSYSLANGQIFTTEKSIGGLYNV